MAASRVAFDCVASPMRSISVRATFLIAKTQQQRFKLTKRLLLILPDCLEYDTVAAIQIGTKHFDYAVGREILLAFANRDCALEPDHASNKLCRRSRVQPELVDNFDFLAHAVQSGGLESAFGQQHESTNCNTEQPRAIRNDDSRSVGAKNDATFRRTNARRDERHRARNSSASLFVLSGENSKKRFRSLNEKGWRRRITRELGIHRQTVDCQGATGSSLFTGRVVYCVYRASLSCPLGLANQMKRKSH